MNAINNQTSPNFKGICIKKSMMTRSQNTRAYNLAEQLPFARCYDKFEKEGKDIFILPGKSINNLLVRVIDNLSGEYYRNPANNKIAELSVSIENGRARDVADNILEFLNEICTQKPKENMFRIFEGKTPLMKAMPDAKNELADMTSTAKRMQDEFGFSKKNAIEYAVDNFKFHIPEKGFDFDF